MKEKLLSNFLKISSIPRKSGNEAQIANFFIFIKKYDKIKLYSFCLYSLMDKTVASGVTDVGSIPTMGTRLIGNSILFIRLEF